MAHSRTKRGLSYTIAVRSAKGRHMQPWRLPKVAYGLHLFGSHVL